VAQRSSASTLCGAPLLGRSARTLFRGYRLDDGPASSPGESLGMACNRHLEECPHGCALENVQGLQDDMAYLIARTTQDPTWIGQLRTAREEEADPARVERNGQDGIGCPVGRPKCQGQRVEVVVHELERAGELFADLRPCGPRNASHIRTEPGDEAC